MLFQDMEFILVYLFRYAVVRPGESAKKWNGPWITSIWWIRRNRTSPTGNAAKTKIEIVTSCIYNSDEIHFYEHQEIALFWPSWVYDCEKKEHCTQESIKSPLLSHRSWEI